MQPTLPFDAAGPSPDIPALPRPPVFVRHPRARRYIVCVREDGTVRVTIPRRGSKREARAFAEEQQPWIERQLRRLEVARARPSAQVLAPEVERELRSRARRELPARLLALATEQGLSVSRVSVRNQRGRWGSCSRSGHICLNWRLVQMPAPVRDYVLIHELMHLKQLDHSRRFWKLVERACPDYCDARAWLRRHADDLTSPNTSTSQPDRGPA